MTFSDPEFLKQLRAKQSQMMSGIVMDGARQMQIRLVAEVNEVVKKLKRIKIDARVITPPGGGVAGGTKSYARAAEKVYQKVEEGGKLNGDWLEIRDLARCTLVVLSRYDADLALRVLEAHFRTGSSGFTIEHNQLKEGGGRWGRTILASSNAAGYSGWSINVSRGGHKAEIQVNYPEMMYAKDLKEFVYAFPGEEAKMRATFPLVPGGIGHILYETSRKPGVPKNVQDAYAAASNIYYAYFRSKPVDLALGKAAAAAVAALNPPVIVTHA